MDQSQLRNKTQTDMADYDPTLSGINEVSNKLLRVESLWKNRDLVKTTVDTLESIDGFIAIFK